MRRMATAALVMAGVAYAPVARGVEEPRPEGPEEDRYAVPTDRYPLPDEGAPDAKVAGTAAEPPPEEDKDDRFLRPHTIFQAGLSLLALPAAELCPVSDAACEPAETSIGLN